MTSPGEESSKISHHQAASTMIKRLADRVKKNAVVNYIVSKTAMLLAFFFFEGHQIGRGINAGMVGSDMQITSTNKYVKIK